MKERPRLLFLTISPLRAVLYRPTRRQLVVLLCTEPAHGTRYGCAYRKRRKDFSSYRTAAKPIYDWTAAICHKEHMLDDSPLSLLFFFFWVILSDDDSSCETQIRCRIFHTSRSSRNTVTSAWLNCCRCCCCRRGGGPGRLFPLVGVNIT